jgi:hypothetical protein
MVLRKGLVSAFGVCFELLVADERVLRTVLRLSRCFLCFSSPQNKTPTTLSNDRRCQQRMNVT